MPWRRCRSHYWDVCSACASSPPACLRRAATGEAPHATPATAPLDASLTTLMTSPSEPATCCYRCARSRSRPWASLAVAVMVGALLLGTRIASAAVSPGAAAGAEDADVDAEVDAEADDDAGLLSTLGSLLRATASRLSGLVLGVVPEAPAKKPAAASRRVRYHGYQVLRVQLRSRQQAAQLRQLVEQQDGVQLWKHARRNRTADVLLPPALAPALKESLDDWGLSYSVLSADVQKMISFHNPPQRLNAQRRSSMLRNRGHPFTWKRYHRYQDIVSYLYYLAANYPSLAQVLPIGTSSEGRPLYVLKISSQDSPQHKSPNTTDDSLTPRHTQKKPAVWIDAGTHGREWIGPAVALYTAMQLVERREKHAQLVRDADWYILAVLNPDGYEFSHTTDRLWRKTRSTPELQSGRLFGRVPCTGVDLNRNWDYNWGDRAGASDNPCSDTYAGPRPFSEPESRATASFIKRRQERIQLFLSLHSYSQLWLIPENASYKRLHDHQELYNKAVLAVKALRRVRNTKYQIGTASDMLYTISGCADNWAKSVAGIKYAYTVELPDRGRYGFLLPASFIVPTGKETFAAIKELTKSIVCKP